MAAIMSASCPASIESPTLPPFSLLYPTRLAVVRPLTDRAAKGHGKAMGVGGVRQDFEFQSWLLRLGVRYLTGGSDVGYILSAGRADVKQLRELKL